MSSGVLRTVGRVLNRGKSQFIAETVVSDSDGKEVGRGNGIFTVSKLPLANAPGYGAPREKKFQG